MQVLLETGEFKHLLHSPNNEKSLRGPGLACVYGPSQSPLDT